ncbi:hypothetical protein KI688_009586 [Linnemannia hyalina]|uniref:F-box domain-containing protein n=1 Tax=Linnemannia hyalina TaxID=64524 RepID=A0A9P7XZX3_9FUNG|nr:hypothetical protein KI688_009586 [Linnemannia hyalina]
MSIRKLRNSFQRRLQIDRFVLEQDNQADLSPSPSSPLKNQGYSFSAFAMDHDQQIHSRSSADLALQSSFTTAVTASYSSAVTSDKDDSLYFEQCFSPLDLPPVLLIYFIKFLTPGDLWKLSQVSKTMQSAVMAFMSRSQRFGFEAIRILRQEHVWTDRQLLGVHHEKHYEDMRDRFWITYNQPLRMIIPPFPDDAPEEPGPGVGNEAGNQDADAAVEEDLLTQQQQQQTPAENAMAGQLQTDNAMVEGVINNNHTNNVSAPPPPPSLPALATSAVPNRGIIRSQYWVSQANFLFAAVLESSEGFQSSDGFQSSPFSQGQGGDQEMEGPETVLQAMNPATAAAALVSAMERGNDPAMGAFWTNQYETTKNISSQVAKLAMVDKTGLLLPATKDRFWSLVQLLFDSNLVDLAYRRAIINCARYMTAKFDSCFAYGLRVNGRVVLDTDYYDYEPKEYSVKMGPHLAVDPDPKSLESADAPVEPKRDNEERRTVTPPRRLQSTFQAMLWGRCLTDVVRIYNQIQELHNIPVVISVPSAIRDLGSKNNDLSEQVNLRHRQKEVTEQHHPIGRGFRKMIHRIRSVAKRRRYTCGGNVRETKVLFTHRGVTSCSLPASFSPGSPTFALFTASAPTFGDAPRPQAQQPTSSSQSGCQDPYQHRRRTSELPDPNNFDDFFRVKKSELHSFQQRVASMEKKQRQRRAIMEERIRRETMLKEELLGLCHMACGLFVVRSQRQPEQGGPRSIMTLLRQGSPWKKGVWRSGEWQHAPIDLDHDLDETAMAHRHHLERDYNHLKRFVGSHRRWSSFDHSSSSSVSSFISSPSPSLSSDSLTSFFTDASTLRPTTRGTTDAFDGNEYASISDILDILPLNATTKQDDTIDHGAWQSLSLATINFLMDENLAWGGNDPNHELSKLKATLHEGAWYYHD